MNRYRVAACAALLILGAGCATPAEDEASPGEVPATEAPTSTSSTTTRPTPTTRPAPTTTEDPLANLTPAEEAQLDAFLNPPPPPTTVFRAPAPSCDPNYSGCVPIASDVDCAGGEGDGPAYTGPTTVIGTDIYDLDSDGDGSACTS